MRAGTGSEAAHHPGLTPLCEVRAGRWGVWRLAVPRARPALDSPVCSASVSRTTSPPGSARRCASSADASRTKPAASLTPRGRRCHRRRPRDGRLGDARRSAHPIGTGRAQARRASHSCASLPHVAGPPGGHPAVGWCARHPSHQNTAPPQRPDRRLAGHFPTDVTHGPPCSGPTPPAGVDRAAVSRRASRSEAAAGRVLGGEGGPNGEDPGSRYPGRGRRSPSTRRPVDASGSPMRVPAGSRC